MQMSSVATGCHIMPYHAMRNTGEAKGGKTLQHVYSASVKLDVNGY